MDERGAGELVRSLIETEIAEGHARNSSLEQRGLAIITTSGVLVSLVSAVLGVEGLRGAHNSHSWVVALAVVAAVLCFLCAATAGISANMPKSLRATDIEGVGGIAWMTGLEPFRADVEAADRRIAEVRVLYLTSLRSVNVLKGRALAVGLYAEVLGAALLAAAAGLASVGA